MVAAGVASAANQRIIVAGGCFWCVEADFEGVEGVEEVVLGFTGGHITNPTYKEVTQDDTGHYEAARIIFDSSKISLAEILHLYFRSVDPTDDSGQFCDRGDRYRTAIFVRGRKERAIAEAARAEAQSLLTSHIVTPILEAGRFYRADSFHQGFYKSTRILPVTTAGIARPKAEAYAFYRKQCGRDARLRELWGDQAVFSISK